MAGPIKILRITTTVRKGGAGAHVLALHNGLNKTPDFESFLISPRDDAGDPRSIPFPFGRLSSNLNFLKTRLLGLDSYFSPLWMHRFQRLVPQFDIIHLHHLQGYFFDLRSLRSLRRKNVVLTLHDFWPLTGRCSVLVDCERWRNVCGHCPRRDIYPAALLDWSHFLHEKKKEYFGGLQRLKVVVLSKYEEGVVKQSYLRDKECVVIPPGIDGDVFRPLPRKNEKITIGVMAAKVGDKLKGFDVILRLIDYLGAMPRRPYHIHIVGFLSAVNRGRLRKFPFVSHTSFVADENDLNRLYNSFDVFVNFSRQETFGKTVVEAQSAGVPVLARRIPAFEENVLFGRLTENDDPESVLHEVEHILYREWDRREMHQSMRKYSVQNMVERYSKLYRSFGAF